MSLHTRELGTCNQKPIIFFTPTDSHLLLPIRNKEMDYSIFHDDLFTTDGDGNDISATILRAICNDDERLNPLYGESLQSSSPADVSFWPMHPAVDRLFQWKLIRTGFGDKHWGPNGKDKNASCHGHSKHDVLIWKNLVDDDNRLYTNAELYDMCVCFASCMYSFMMGNYPSDQASKISSNALTMRLFFLVALV